jgi:hypothetical protein
LFGRDENHEHARRFINGLLAGGGQDRRNVENIAEIVEGGVVRTLQKFVAQGAWEDAAVLKEVRAHVAETLGDAKGTINVDETGFPKKGKKSVGVKRQYSGTLGRVDNCQIGVFANYYSSQGHTFIDRRIYLPEEWSQDRPRRREAGVPENVVFRTKPFRECANLASGTSWMFRRKLTCGSSNRKSASLVHVVAVGSQRQSPFPSPKRRPNCRHQHSDASSFRKAVKVRLCMSMPN